MVLSTEGKHMKPIILFAALAFSFATPAFADGGCGNCAVDQLDTRPLPQTPEDGCSNCALPTQAGQRADTGKRILVASPRCPSGKRVMGRCLQ
jgi:hypothetical protein